MIVGGNVLQRYSNARYKPIFRTFFFYKSLHDISMFFFEGYCRLNGCTEVQTGEGSNGLQTGLVYAGFNIICVKRVKSLSALKKNKKILFVSKKKYLFCVDINEFIIFKTRKPIKQHYSFNPKQ